MIDYPDDKVVESMARIRHDPDFKRIIEWLEAEGVSVAKRSMVMNDKDFVRMQGAYLAIDEILKVAKDAAAIIDAAHERKKRPRTHIP